MKLFWDKTQWSSNINASTWSTQWFCLVLETCSLQLPWGVPRRGTLVLTLLPNHRVVTSPSTSGMICTPLTWGRVTRRGCPESVRILRSGRRPSTWPTYERPTRAGTSARLSFWTGPLAHTLKTGPGSSSMFMVIDKIRWYLMRMHAIYLI